MQAPVDRGVDNVHGLLGRPHGLAGQAPCTAVAENTQHVPPRRPAMAGTVLYLGARPAANEVDDQDDHGDDQK
jgi:hypothetical protein